jgi:hypothetical protein
MERSLKTSTAITRYLGLAALALLLQACSSSLSGGPIYGKVLDERFDRPIPDVFVIARWTCQAGHDSGAACYHVSASTTDAQGRYEFPAWKKEGKDYCVAHPYVYLRAYKPGYAESDFSSVLKEITHLQPFTGGTEERMGYLRRVSSSTGCLEAGESMKNLLPLKRALYEEARSIAVTPADKQLVENLLSISEFIEFGYDASIKRAAERSGERK